MKRESRGGPRHYWTPEDDKMLIGGIDTMTFGELCRTLGREPQAVGLRCGKLGITVRDTMRLDVLQQTWFGDAQ